jgi:hypothetical protein
MLHWVEISPDGNLTPAGTIMLGINGGIVLGAHFVLGGFIAAVLAPARQWWHGLGVGAVSLALIALLWADSVRRGDATVPPEFDAEQVITTAGILVGCIVGGLAGEWLMNRLRPGHPNERIEPGEPPTA